MHVSPRGEERVRRGHPWIYRADVVARPRGAGRHRHDARAARPAARRRAVQRPVADRAARADARGRGRRTRRSGARGSQTAVRFRERLGIDATAYRLVHGEADLLPSLIVDRYGDWLVLQALSQGIDRHIGDDHRAAGGAAGAEGHPRAQRPARAAARRARADGRSAARRGARDHRDRRARRPLRRRSVARAEDRPVPRSAREPRGRGPLRAGPACSTPSATTAGSRSRSRRSADEVVALDISADAVARIAANAAANGLGNVTAREVNVFDELRHFERSGERFDTIVLDPPAFAKNKASVPKAIAGYKDINLRALRILKPGGTLVTCSCSYNVDEALFLDILQRRRGRRARVGHDAREADAGPRSSRARRRARDLLSEVRDPAEGGVTGLQLVATTGRTRTCIARWKGRRSRERRCSRPTPSSSAATSALELPLSRADPSLGRTRRADAETPKARSRSTSATTPHAGRSGSVTRRRSPTSSGSDQVARRDARPRRCGLVDDAARRARTRHARSREGRRHDRRRPSRAPRISSASTGCGDAVAPDGAIWTVRPKGVAEVSEAAVAKAARAAGLVDVKVARVSATHTAEKFVSRRRTEASNAERRTSTRLSRTLANVALGRWRWLASLPGSATGSVPGLTTEGVTAV